MNRDPLDSLLRSVPEPSPTDGQSDAFVGRVLRRLHAAPDSARDAHDSDGSTWSPFRRLTAGFAMAFTLAFVGWGIHLGFRNPHGSPADGGFETAELQAYREVWNQFAILFPHQVRAVTFGPEGPRVILSDRPDLPETPGILVRLCAQDGCRTALTVSGQTVELGTQRLEVLGTARGEVLVTTGNTVWPFDRAALRLSALNLESLL
jgi:hypothetical protein